MQIESKRKFSLLIAIKHMFVVNTCLLLPIKQMFVIRKRFLISYGNSVSRLSTHTHLYPLVWTTVSTDIPRWLARRRWHLQSARLIQRYCAKSRQDLTRKYDASSRVIQRRDIYWYSKMLVQNSPASIKNLIFSACMHNHTIRSHLQHSGIYVQVYYKRDLRIWSRVLEKHRGSHCIQTANFAYHKIGVIGDDINDSRHVHSVLRMHSCFTRTHTRRLGRGKRKGERINLLIPIEHGSTESGILVDLEANLPRLCDCLFSPSFLKSTCTHAHQRRSQTHSFGISKHNHSSPDFDRMYLSSLFIWRMLTYADVCWHIYWHIHPHSPRKSGCNLDLPIYA